MQIFPGNCRTPLKASLPNFSKVNPGRPSGRRSSLTAARNPCVKRIDLLTVGISVPPGPVFSVFRKDEATDNPEKTL